MITTAHALSLACTFAATLAFAAWGRLFASVPVATRPTLGHRGRMRQQALAGGFALVEPVVRVIAGYVSLLPLGHMRTRLGTTIVQAGDHLGLDADDCIALSALGAVSFSAGATALAHHAALDESWIVLATGLGASLPLLALQERRRARERQVSRALPAAIDLAALCMGAGLDFSGALELLARESNDPEDHLALELRRILQELSMGRTRREALLGFGERMPSPAVRDFVSAVVQAEEKGNPLSEVLRVQAQVLRTRRSVAGEEAAARASVMLTLPLVLLLGCILLVMLGPFLVNGMGFE